MFFRDNSSPDESSPDRPFPVGILACLLRRERQAHPLLILHAGPPSRIIPVAEATAGVRRDLACRLAEKQDDAVRRQLRLADAMDLARERRDGSHCLLSVAVFAAIVLAAVLCR